MKSYPTEKIRNIALAGHQHTGKTSFLEAMLFETKQVSRQARVDDGNSNLDFVPEEVERRITMHCALAHVDWKGHKLNFVDTPGYDDFVAEWLGALAAVETVLLFAAADGGFDVGAERAWRHLEEHPRARFVVVNKMDKEHADFRRCVAELRSRISSKIVPLHIPIGSGEAFKGYVDVVSGKAYAYAAGGASEIPVPSELAAAVAEAHEELQNAAAETDDALTEKFLETGGLSLEEFRTGLARGIAAGTVYPAVPLCAARSLGIAALLDVLVEYAPSPAMVLVRGTKPADATPLERRPEAAEPLAALAFKTISESNVGDYTYVRVFAGKLIPGQDVQTSRGEAERIGPVYHLNGKVRSDAESLLAGDIGAVVKLKTTHTGDTLCDRTAPMALGFPVIPTPLTTVAIRAKGKGDEDKLSGALHRLHEEDPSFKVEVHPETHQTLLSGQGDTHLSILIGRLKRKFHVEVEVDPPKTPYRETIKGSADERYRHKKQSGGRGQFGEVHLKVDPLPRGAAFEFVNAVVGGVIPTKFLPAVEKGIREAMHEGVIAGYPVVDVRVTVDDGKDHAVDSSEAAFKIAGSMAFRGAIPKAKPILLEPIYHVEVHVPEEYMGDVMSDMSSRRGRIQGMTQDGGRQILRAEVPLAELYSYATGLRSLSQGRASYTRSFSHYEEVPREAAESVIAAHKAAQQHQVHDAGG